jgi:hypothetical protein
MAKAAWKGSGDSSNEGDFKTLLEKYGLNEFRIKQILLTIVLIISNMTGRNQ